MTKAIACVLSTCVVLAGVTVVLNPHFRLRGLTWPLRPVLGGPGADHGATCQYHTR
jgi:hypothetical protein